VLRSQHRVYNGRGEVARTQDVWGAEGISGRGKFLLLAWAGMPKTNFRKNSDSPLYYLYTYEQDRHSSTQDAYRHRCPYILIGNNLILSIHLHIIFYRL
jgi:hypothetical protein